MKIFSTLSHWESTWQLEKKSKSNGSLKMHFFYWNIPRTTDNNEYVSVPVFVCVFFFYLLFLLFTFNTPCSVIALAVLKCILSTSHDVRTYTKHNCAATESRRKHKHKHTYTNARFFTFKTCEFDPQICVYIEMEFLNLVRVKVLTFLCDLMLLLLL